MAALGIIFIIIGLLVVLISFIALVNSIRRKRRPWIWLVVYGAGWVFTITGIILYVLLLPTTNTRDASELVLTANDFKYSWIQVESGAVSEEGAQSAYHVSFSKDTGEAYCPVAQNTVAVYPDINSAKMAYLGTKPTDIPLVYPEIGDECFLNSYLPEYQVLVFRKSNVVVWIWLEQDVYGNAEPYAEIVEKRISGIESSTKVG